MAKEEQIKTSIDLTGEKEYRAACADINSSLREIGSEMKLTAAQFADNADSVEALTAKQKTLQKQFDEQAKKAAAAEKALKKMRDNGIEPTNPAYQKMQTNLNNTKADMIKIQREIDDTSKKLKSNKVDWESVGETVGKAGKAIGAAVTAMGAAIGAAAGAFFGLAEETREARENMGKLETSFTTAGHSAEDAKNTYTELYGILGDDGQATEAAAHLAKLTTNEKELTAFTAQHQKFVQEGTNVDKSFAQGMVAGIPQITAKVPQIMQSIITAIREFYSQFVDAGEYMVEGIWQGFQNMSGWLESRVRSMMQEIVAAVEDEMDIASPSKVFAGIGEYMAQGLGEGFAREMRSVESTIRRETSNAVPEVRSGEGRQPARGTTPTVEVVQHIYANETSYAAQQRQAARQFRQIAREVMA